MLDIIQNLDSFASHLEYHSPKISKSIPNDVNGNLAYEGTLEQVLQEISNGLATDKRARSFQSSRLIRAAVEYKIGHPGNNQAEDLLKDAIETALRAYTSPSKSAEFIEQFRSSVGQSGLDDILALTIRQPNDPVTWRAMSPKLSKSSASTLYEGIGNANVLFIALGHGGVGAGMEVYTTFCTQAKSNDSRFYVVRYSTQKSGDTEPRVSEREIEYLRSLAEGRQIVIFDEDSASGHTIRTAKLYFETKIFNDKQISTLCNIDMLGTIKNAGFELHDLKEDSDMLDHFKVKEAFTDLIKSHQFINNKNFVSYENCTNNLKKFEPKINIYMNKRSEIDKSLLESKNFNTAIQSEERLPKKNI